MTKPKLDRIDIAILSHLQENGRMTNAALAEAVGLSQSPCLQRVRRLEEAGFILGYGARINPDLIGESLTVFTEFTLENHRAADFARFEAGVAAAPEVVECHLVSGGYDYLVRFACRNVADYQKVIERLLDSGLGVEKYFSYVVIKSPVGPRQPLAGALFDGKAPK